MYFWSFRLYDRDFKILGKKIVEIFKEDDIAIYYKPPIRRKDLSVKKGRGKIYNKYKNLTQDSKKLASINNANNDIKLSRIGIINISSS